MRIKVLYNKRKVLPPYSSLLYCYLSYCSY
nr:MAG TPA: hypothetical protein [Caudoviricetes sp.]